MLGPLPVDTFLGTAPTSSLKQTKKKRQKVSNVMNKKRDATKTASSFHFQWCFRCIVRRPSGDQRIGELEVPSNRSYNVFICAELGNAVIIWQPAAAEHKQVLIYIACSMHCRESIQAMPQALIWFQEKDFHTLCCTEVRHLTSVYPLNPQE